MESIDSSDAKTQLDQLVEQVEVGVEIVSARAGRPVARLVPHRARSGPRQPGEWRGRVHFAPDFDEADPVLPEGVAGR